jgi:hypothetical protein
MLIQSLKQIFLSASVAFVVLATATAVTAQVEPQQGAINTSRSNLKNTNREAQAGPAIKGVWVRLAKSHELTHVAQSSRVTTTDDAGNFTFADVAPGEYVLTFSATELKADTMSERPSGTVGGLGTQLNDLSARSLDNKITTIEQPLTARIVVTGAAAPIEKAWPVKVKQSPNSAQRDGHTRFDPLFLDTTGDDAKRPGSTRFGTIVLRVEAGGGKLLSGHVSLINRSQPRVN